MALIKVGTNAITALPAGVGGSLVKLETVTANNTAAAMDLTSASSTYNSYLLVGALISPAANDSSLECQVIDSNGNALTDAWSATGWDGQSSSRAFVYEGINGADFNPSGASSTTYQFSFHMYVHGLYEARQPNVFFAGSNTWASVTTSAISSVRLAKFSNAGSGQKGIRFKFHNATNFNTGTITMYGFNK